jgi:cytochrome oxidase assembly protein ShyY1
MTKVASNRLTLTALILLGCVAFVCLMLGRWQLERAEVRRQVAATIEAGRRAPPLTLSPNIPISELQAWRPAVVQGQWRSEWSVLLENRNLDGQPGLWLATPLMLGPDTAVLVLRGWIERPIAERPVPKIPTAQSTVELTGELAIRVPRLFELWTSEANAAASLPQGWMGTQQPVVGVIDPVLLPRLQNLDLEQYAKRTGLKFLPTVLMQRSEKDEEGLKRVWPEPSVDSDKNVAYAMQWFGFAGIVLIAFLVIVWRRLRMRQSP